MHCLGPHVLLLQVSRDSDLAEVAHYSLLIPPPAPLRCPQPCTLAVNYCFATARFDFIPSEVRWMPGLPLACLSYLFPRTIKCFLCPGSFVLSRAPPDLPFWSWSDTEGHGWSETTPCAPALPAETRVPSWTLSSKSSLTETQEVDSFASRS